MPEDLDVHLIVDNYCTDKHAKVRAWLAQRPLPRPLHTHLLRLLAEPGGTLV